MKGSKLYPQVKFRTRKKLLALDPSDLVLGVFLSFIFRRIHSVENHNEELLYMEPEKLQWQE